MASSFSRQFLHQFLPSFPSFIHFTLSTSSASPITDESIATAHRIPSLVPPLLSPPSNSIKISRLPSLLPPYRRRRQSISITQRSPGSSRAHHQHSSTPNLFHPLPSAVLSRQQLQPNPASRRPHHHQRLRRLNPAEFTTNASANSSPLPSFFRSNSQQQPSTNRRPFPSFSQPNHPQHQRQQFGGRRLNLRQNRRHLRRHSQLFSNIPTEQQIKKHGQHVAAYIFHLIANFVASNLHRCFRPIATHFRARHFPLFPNIFRVSMKKLAALLLLIVLLAGFLLHLAELLDVYCDTDSDCRPPTVCRLVCRRNCKSVCVLVVPEELNGGEESGKGAPLLELPNSSLNQPSEIVGRNEGNGLEEFLVQKPDLGVLSPIESTAIKMTESTTKTADSTKIDGKTTANTTDKFMANLTATTIENKQQQQQRKLHRRPTSIANKSSSASEGSTAELEKSSDEEKQPFETNANPFASAAAAAAAAPFRSPLNGPLPPPEKKSTAPKQSLLPSPSPVTPLTISEAELEAELRQQQLREENNGGGKGFGRIGAGDDGPIGFVTAPGTSAEIGDVKATTPDPFDPSSSANSRESIFATAPSARQRANGGRGQIKQQLMLSTSMELVTDDSLFRRRTTPLGGISITSSTVSPPSFSPQPPGLMPSHTNPFRSTTTPSIPSTTTKFPSTTPSNSLLLGRHPPNGAAATERSKEANPYSGEEFERQKAGLGKQQPSSQSQTSSPQQFYKSTERLAPWFPKTPLVRPPPPSATTLSPFLAALRRTTQRVPVHRPQPFNWHSRSSTLAAGGPTTQRTTLRNCDSPPVCGKNCGVVIDPDGCQSCQCLWASSKTCFSDVDCRPLEGQVCDLGRCECGPGYAHHPSQSGVCIPSDLAQPARQRGVTLTQSSPIPASSPVLSPSPASSWPIVSGRSQHQLPVNRQFAHLYRHQLYYRQRQRMVMRWKRDAEETAMQKPHREERLQWPGPCDSDDQCPPQLFCVEGDCWTLEPEKASQRQQRDPSAATATHSHVEALVRGASRKSALVGKNNKLFGKIGDKAKVVAATEQPTSGSQSTLAEHSQTTELVEKEQSKTTGQEGPSLTITTIDPAEGKKQEELSTNTSNSGAESSQKPRQLPSKSSKPSIAIPAPPPPFALAPTAIGQDSAEELEDQIDEGDEEKQQQGEYSSLESSDEEDYAIAQHGQKTTTKTTLNTAENGQEIGRFGQTNFPNFGKHPEEKEAALGHKIIAENAIDGQTKSDQSNRAEFAQGTNETGTNFSQQKGEEPAQKIIEENEKNKVLLNPKATTEFGNGNATTFMRDDKEKNEKEFGQENVIGTNLSAPNQNLTANSQPPSSQSPILLMAIQSTTTDTDSSSKVAPRIDPSVDGEQQQSTVTVIALPQATIALRHPAPDEAPKLPADAPTPPEDGAEPIDLPNSNRQRQQPPVEFGQHQKKQIDGIGDDAIHPPSARPLQDWHSNSNGLRQQSSQIGPPAITPPASFKTEEDESASSKEPRAEFDSQRRLAPSGTSTIENGKGPTGPTSPPSSPSSPIPLPISRQSPQIDRSHHKGLEQIPTETDIEIGPRGTELLVTESVENEQRQIFHDYSRRNRIRRPVRVEMTNSKELMKDECHSSRDCGRRFVCCLKRWCDLGGECGLAKFCLPSCELTKLTHLSELGRDEIPPRMDLIYD